MRNKKKLFALVLFILMGFFMFTFANPSDGINSLTTLANDKKDKDIEEVKEVTKISDNNPQMIVAVDNAPIITVTPKELKIIRGVDYDVTTGVVVTDDKDVNLKPVVSMTSMLDAEIGVYTLTYTVTDSGNNTRTATRTIKVLEPGADEDNDGYTNKEEYDNDTDFDNVDKYPEYEKNPSIIINEENIYSMEINTTIPTFNATATDVADGDIDVVITNDIDLTKLGKYTVVFTAIDLLGNKTEVTKEFTVVDTTKPKINPEYWRKTVEADKTATFVCPTATATDNSNDVVTANYLRNNVDMGTPGEYKCQYSAKDSSGNTAYNDIFITVVDTTKPKINPEYWRKTVKTDKTATFVCPTATVTDNSKEVIAVNYLGNNVNLKAPGEYKCQYSAKDSSGNTAYNDVFITVIPQTYTVIFKDYNGVELKTQTVIENESYQAPDMTGKTYTSKGITYTFIGWDKTVNNVTSNLIINANYDITKVVATLYELDRNIARPTNGGGLAESNYKKLGTIEIKALDDIKNIIKTNTKNVLTYDLTSVLTYVNDQTLLPVPTDKDENFTKYEFYVLKFEPANGWHIDCQAVTDNVALDNYRNSTIAQINNYATSFEFDSTSLEITGIVSASGIGSLTTKSTIDSAVNSAKSAIDSLFVGIKSSAKNEIQTAINNQALKNNYVTQANSIRDTANSNIDNALTISSINSLKSKAITDINNLKALSLLTFNATITTVPNDWNYKYLVINDIASDVVITKVKFGYEYLDWFKIKIRFEDKYLALNNNYIARLLVNNRLEDSDELIIEYVKNGIAYSASYYVNRNWSNTIIVGVTKYSDTYSA